MVTRRELVQDSYKSQIALAMVAIAVTLFWFATSFSPETVPKNPTTQEFSGKRALDVMHNLLPNNVRRPVGSAESHRAVKAIVDEFEKLGYEPRVEHTHAAYPGFFWALQNIIVDIPGSEGSQTILLMGHHDSVVASVGFSDDFSSVGIALETARALKALPQTKQNIRILLTDGEEMGLLGAEAYAKMHSDTLGEIACVINIDAGGTAGPSIMYELGPGSGFITERFLQHSTRPITSSLFPAVYDRMPNDTDMSVFKDRGIPGLNFAYIGNKPQYHTMLDNRNNFDVDSIHHQGSNVFNTMLALANETTIRKGENLVFFDIGGLFAIAWSVKTTLIIALVSFIVAIASLVINTAIRVLSVQQIVKSILMFSAVVIVTALIGWIAVEMFQLISGEEVFWYSMPYYFLATMLLLHIGVGLLIAYFFHGSVEPIGIMSVTWAILSIVAVLAAGYLPGAAYPFVFTSLVGSILTLTSGLLRFIGKFAQLVAATVIVMSMLAVLTGSTIGGVSAVGFSMSALIILPLVLLTVALLPIVLLCQRGSLAKSSALVVVVSLLMLAGSTLVPTFDSENPRPVNISIWQDNDSGKAIWTAYPEYHANKIFDREEVSATDAEDIPTFLAEREASPFGTLSISEQKDLRWQSLAADSDNTYTTYTLRLEMPENCTSLMLATPMAKDNRELILSHPDLEENVTMIGTAVDFDYQMFRIMTVAKDGVKVTMKLPNGKSQLIYAISVIWDMPEAAKPVLDKRHSSFGIAAHDGDQWFSVNRLQLSIPTE